MNTNARLGPLRAIAIGLLIVSLLALMLEKPASSMTPEIAQDKSKPVEEAKKEGISVPSHEGNLPKGDTNEPQKSDSNKPATVTEVKTIVAGEVAKINEAAAGQFAGLHFGVGVSGTLTLGRDRIDGAKVVNGIVRVDGEKTSCQELCLKAIGSGKVVRHRVLDHL